MKLSRIFEKEREILIAKQDVHSKFNKHCSKIEDCDSCKYNKAENCYIDFIKDNDIEII